LSYWLPVLTVASSPHWLSRGLSVRERVELYVSGCSLGPCALSRPYTKEPHSLEARWAYFAGFGLPITLVSFFHPSRFVNLALFSLGFPFALLMASTAEPTPLDPTHPSTLALDAGTHAPAPASTVPISLPVLRGAVWLSDKVVKLLNPQLKARTKKSAEGRVHHVPTHMPGIEHYGGGMPGHGQAPQPQGQAHERNYHGTSSLARRRKAE
jgi:hypothetical protein